MNTPTCLFLVCILVLNISCVMTSSNCNVKVFSGNLFDQESAGRIRYMEVSVGSASSRSVVKVITPSGKIFDAEVGMLIIDFGSSIDCSSQSKILLYDDEGRQSTGVVKLLTLHANSRERTNNVYAWETNGASSVLWKDNDVTYLLIQSNDLDGLPTKIVSDDLDVSSDIISDLPAKTEAPKTTTGGWPTEIESDESSPIYYVSSVGGRAIPVAATPRPTTSDFPTKTEDSETTTGSSTEIESDETSSIYYSNSAGTEIESDESSPIYYVSSVGGRAIPVAATPRPTTSDFPTKTEDSETTTGSSTEIESDEASSIYYVNSAGTEIESDESSPIYYVSSVGGPIPLATTPRTTTPTTTETTTTTRTTTSKTSSTPVTTTPTPDTTTKTSSTPETTTHSSSTTTTTAATPGVKMLPVALPDVFGAPLDDQDILPAELFFA